MSFAKESHKASLFETALQANGTSDLGLKSHWESEFARDLHQFMGQPEHHKSIENSNVECVSDSDDEREIGGHCWFGPDVARKMVEFAAPFCSEGMTILDMGTGNGDLIFRMAEMLSEQNIKAKFIGVDYCSDAISICQNWSQSRLVDGISVSWIVDDAFQPKHVQKGTVDVLLDKGMLDAVSMNGSVAMVKDYLNSLSLLGKPGKTFFCITSANFTVEELNDVVITEGWKYLSHVTDYPTFQFGGVTGTHVRTVIYQLTDIETRS